MRAALLLTWRAFAALVKRAGCDRTHELEPDKIIGAVLGAASLARRPTGRCCSACSRPPVRRRTGARASTAPRAWTRRQVRASLLSRDVRGHGPPREGRRPRFASRRSPPPGASCSSSTSASADSAAAMRAVHRRASRRISTLEAVLASCGSRAAGGPTCCACSSRSSCGRRSGGRPRRARARRARADRVGARHRRAGVRAARGAAALAGAAAPTDRRPAGRARAGRPCSLTRPTRCSAWPRRRATPRSARLPPADEPEPSRQAGRARPAGVDARGRRSRRRRQIQRGLRARPRSARHAIEYGQGSHHAVTPVIAPSILSADFARLGEEVRGRARGRRRLDPLRRDGQSLRAEPHDRAAGVRGAAQARRQGADRRAPDGRSRWTASFRTSRRPGATWISFHPEASEHVDRTIELIREHGLPARASCSIRRRRSTGSTTRSTSSTWSC